MSVADNLAANNAKVAYTSYFETDKILGVYTGTLAIAGAGTFSSGYSANLVSAGPGVKCLTQMAWSLDAGVTWQDGDSSIRTYSGGSLQYDLEVTSAASASGIYVIVNNNGEVSVSPARTIQYKVVAMSIT